MDVIYGTEKEIDSWMELVVKISPEFPGLDTLERIEDHRKTVIKFMEKNIQGIVK